MGTSLFGLKPKNTYQGLLKTTDNSAIDATSKFVSDGLGNDSALSLSTSLVGIGTTSPTGKLQVNNATNGALISRFKDTLAATTYIDFKTDPTLTDRMGIYWGSDYRFLSKQGASLFINCEYNAVFANGLQAITTITPSEVQVGTISGARLGVKGTGATSATTSLLVQNSASTQILKVSDGNQVIIGSSTYFPSGVGLMSSTQIYCPKITNSDGVSGLDISNGNFFQDFSSSSTATVSANSPYSLYQSRQYSGLSIINNITETGTPTTATYKSINLTQTVNQTLGTGKTWGLYINHTVTAAADHSIAEFIQGSNSIQFIQNNSSSLMALNSTTKGFLPPRMTDAQARAIVTPAEGLVVYNTTISHLCCYQGGAWVRFSHSPM